MLSVPLAVHEKFKARRPSYVRRAIGATLVLHASLFYFGPPIEFQPYESPEPMSVVTLEDVQEYDYIPDEPAQVDGADVPAPPPAEPEVSPEPPPETTADIVGLGPTLSAGFVSRPQSFVAVDELPKLIKPIKADYPPLAREAGIEGAVRVKVVVGADGRVLAVEVLSSDVTASMERAAVEAAKRALFKPGRQGHKAVKSTVVIPFHFKLEACH